MPEKSENVTITSGRVSAPLSLGLGLITWSLLTLFLKSLIFKIFVIHTKHRASVFKLKKALFSVDNISTLQWQIQTLS